MNIRSTMVGWLFLLNMGFASAASDYGACILEKLPGTQSNVAFVAGVQLCTQAHPDQYFTIKRGAGRGILSFKSPNACTVDKAKATSWQPAAYQIRRACECLYGDSRGDWDMCQRYELPQSIREQHENFKSVADQVVLEHHYRRIYAAHPDADDLFNRGDFQAWWLSDPARTKILKGGSANQIIKLMSDFKAVSWERGALSPPPTK